MQIKSMAATVALSLLMLNSAADAASLERAPADGTPGIARIFVPDSQVSRYQARGYQVIDYVPATSILQAYVDLMCNSEPSDASVADRFGVARTQLCSSAQAYVAERNQVSGQ